MNKKEILKHLTLLVKQRCSDNAAHDFYHVLRVLNTAKLINKEEKADSFILEVICLIHDVCDHKFFSGDSNKELMNIFKEVKLNSIFSLDEMNKIIFDATHLGFSENTDSTLLSKEGQIAQDSDRLDMLGAIGMARCFSYSGKLGHPIYDPNISLEPLSRSEYKKTGSLTGINHFYDKILNIKNSLNTGAAKKIAIKREKLVYDYLNQFFLEWNGKI